MEYPLNLMTVDSAKVLNRLQSFLSNMSNYPNFDDKMLLNIFVNIAGDFTAFEAVNYNIGFTSTDHKLIETISSKYKPIRTDFQSFYDKVFAI